MPDPLDPYDPRCVHGLWPLVADPDHPAGIRFAVMGRDAAGDCVAHPSALPDAGLEIRTFANPEARDAWVSAVAEFGGNAVLAEPLAAEGACAALAVRFDRARTRGDSLDGCVALLGPLPEGLPYLRSEERLRVARRERESGWRSAWATELAEAGPAYLRIDALNAPPTEDTLTLTFRVRTAMTCAKVTKGPGGTRAVHLQPALAEPAYPNDPDLGAELRACIERMGYVPGEGGASRSFATPVGMLASVAGDVAAIAATRKGLDSELTARATIRNARSERSLALLRAMAGGFPVAKAPASSGYAFRLDPGTGAAVDVDGHALMTLWLAGAIAPAWWSDPVARPAPDKPFDAFGRSVWVPTRRGLALLPDDPDIPALARGLPEARRARDATPDRPSPSFGSLSSGPPSPPWSPPPGAAGPSGTGIPRRAKDLAVLAAWVRHGLSVIPEALEAR